jgi:MFS family permease
MNDQNSAAHNPEHEDDRLERRIREQPDITPNRWVRRIVLAIVLLGVAYLVYLMSAAFFPRWWAQRVADQVGGSVTRGTTWGLFYGVVFTAVPLLLLAQVRRRFFSWTWRGIVALVAIALAAPNWLTLSVVAGNSNASHAGERIMDVDAPGFRAATLVGVIVGAVLVIGFTAATMRLKSRRNEVKRLKEERDGLRRARDEDAR